MILYVLATLLAVTIGLGCEPARAHISSDSYLRIDLDAGGMPSGRWDIALRDLDAAIGLETTDDGVVTWGRLKARRAAIEAYAFERLTIVGCALRPAEMLVDYHAGAAYAVLRFDAACDAPTEGRRLRYRLLFDIDPTHRGLLTLVTPAEQRSEILSPDHAEIALDLGVVPASNSFLHFLAFGVDHILHGYDHLLFLAVLLIFSSFRRGENGRWKPLDGIGDALLQTLAILTAFTTAHAITLTLSTLRVVDAPASLVEPAVAATIMAAAIDNLWPVLPRARWLVAFGFGLVHGLAFATALGPMNLKPAGLLIALVGFNSGVELGQIAFASALTPLTFVSRRHRAYETNVAPLLSALAFCVALWWFVDRIEALR